MLKLKNNLKMMIVAKRPWFRTLVPTAAALVEGCGSIRPAGWPPGMDFEL